QHRSDTRQKTEKACLAEWRANKGTRPKGITQDVFVAQCRGGPAVAQTSTSSAAPSTNGTATPLQKPSRPAAHPAKRRVPEKHARSHARPRGENQASRTAGGNSNGGF